MEERPFWMQDTWEFQGTDPVRESHYSLQLPTGWDFRASWLSHSEVKPDEGGGNGLRWGIRDVAGIRPEPNMPPLRGMGRPENVSFFPLRGPAGENVVL